MSFTLWAVAEMSPYRGKQLHPPFLSTGGGRSLLGAAPFGVPLRTPRKAFLPEHHNESRGAFMNKVMASHLNIIFSYK